MTLNRSIRMDAVGDIMLLELREGISSLADHSVLDELSEIRQLRSDAGFNKLIFDLGQAPVMGRRFQFLQRIDVEVMVQPRRHRLADPRHGCQQRDVIGLAPQTIQHRQPSGYDQVPHRVRQAFPDPGQLPEPFQTLRPQNLRRGLVQPLHGIGRVTIGLHAEWIGALLLEKRRHLPKALGDIDVEDLSHGR